MGGVMGLCQCGAPGYDKTWEGVPICGRCARQLALRIKRIAKMQRRARKAKETRAVPKGNR